MTWVLGSILAAWLGLGFITWLGLDRKPNRASFLMAPVLTLTWPLVWSAVLVIAFVHAAAERRRGS